MEGLVKLRILKPISIGQLLKKTPLDHKILAEYNRCILPHTFRSRRFQKLPSNYEIIVPDELVDKVQLALNKIRIPNQLERF